jgi:2,4-didehydro-3-deoxy-L-rhamnonate hydrolase
MKIYRFRCNGEEFLGYKNGDSLQSFRDVKNFAQLLQNPNAELSQQTFRFDEVEILAPLAPGKILCSGVNYYGHKDENPNAVIPEFPFFFAKLPNTVIGPNQPIVKPKMTQQLDYEVEFAVVIGKTIRNANPEQIMDAVFGYTILHDVSARDVQFKDSQITLGKNFDTFAPIGPCVVTKGEIPDLSDVKLSTRVNGRVLQNGSTSDWVFPLPVLLSSLSQVMTLNTGDIVTTGTPAGVGFFTNPQIFLNAGDVVTLEIEGIGLLTNHVVDEE